LQGALRHEPKTLRELHEDAAEQARDKKQGAKIHLKELVHIKRLARLNGYLLAEPPYFRMFEECTEE